MLHTSPATSSPSANKLHPHSLVAAEPWPAALESALPYSSCLTNRHCSKPIPLALHHLTQRHKMVPTGASGSSKSTTCREQGDLCSIPGADGAGAAAHPCHRLLLAMQHGCGAAGPGSAHRESQNLLGERAQLQPQRGTQTFCAWRWVFAVTIPTCMQAVDLYYIIVRGSICQ